MFAPYSPLPDVSRRIHGGANDAHGSHRGRDRNHAQPTDTRSRAGLTGFSASRYDPSGGRLRSKMDRIGIERLCVFGLPPVEFVDLAADLGCRYIATGLTPMPYNPHGYSKWSLRDDPALRCEMLAAMHSRDVSISLCEGFGVRPNADVNEYAADLEVVRELGARRINVASMDRDSSRTFDQFAKIAEMADALGIETTIEIGPGPVPGLPAALAAIRHVGKPNFRLLIDTMHFVRSGSDAADIAALDPSLIGYVQLCDVPLISKHATYMEEAL
jgi:sugar phosphate isomerase/epimerase